MREWNEYFRKLLGVERKVRRENREGRKNDEEKELSREEIEKVLGGLKMGKSAGIDRIANEVWRCGGGEVKGWKNEGWPEIWKEG